eukprot:216875-Pelagomonas_calceolata.AAC.1
MELSCKLGKPPRGCYIAIAAADKDKRGLRKGFTWRYDVFHTHKERPNLKSQARFTLSHKDNVPASSVLQQFGLFLFDCVLTIQTVLRAELKQKMLMATMKLRRERESFHEIDQSVPISKQALPRVTRGWPTARDSG